MDRNQDKQDKDLESLTLEELLDKLILNSKSAATLFQQGLMVTRQQKALHEESGSKWKRVDQIKAFVLENWGKLDV